MRRRICTIILILAIALPSLLTTSYFTNDNPGSNVPRNMYPINVKNNTANPLLSAYLTKLLKDLEDIKLILNKYNSSLSEKIDKLESLIIKGDYKTASELYRSIQDDLKEFLEELKNINPEDYLKLKNLLPKSLYLYGDYDLTDLWNSMSSGNFTTELEYPGNMNISIANNFFNPGIKPISPPSITPPSLESPLLINVFIIVLTSLLGVALIKNRKGLYPLISSIKSRVSLGKPLSYRGISESKDYVTIKYHHFLNIMRKLGFPRRESEAPLEYPSRIGDTMLRNLAIEMGYYFEKVRYGFKKLSKRESDRVDEIISSLEARVK